MILMDLNEQVDWDFSRALRKARLRRLILRLRGKPTSISHTFDEVQRTLRAYNRVRRGIRVVELEKIVGSVGRSRDFDGSFMPLRAAAGERWKRVDLAFYRDQALPPVSLYKLGDDYFVEDGNHRISVARYHGVPDVEADVTELWPISTLQPSASAGQHAA
jgi:hypothetical protein